MPELAQSEDKHVLTGTAGIHEPRMTAMFCGSLTELKRKLIAGKTGPPFADINFRSQPFNLALAVLLPDAEADDAAVRVGERAIRQPEIGGHTTPRPLELDGGILALDDKSLDLFTLHPK